MQRYNTAKQILILEKVLVHYINTIIKRYILDHNVPGEEHGMFPSVFAQVIGGEGAEVTVKGVVSDQIKAILSYVLLGPGKVLAPLWC